MQSLQYAFTHIDAEKHYKGRWERSRAHDAGIDLRVMEDVTLKPNEQKKVASGIAINITDQTMAAIILPRSGSGSNGLVLGNTVGLIDCGYQGELWLTLWNRWDAEADERELLIAAGDRVAQLILVPVFQPRLDRVEDFKPSERGTAGFGSSGAK